MIHVHIAAAPGMDWIFGGLVNRLLDKPPAGMRFTTSNDGKLFDADVIHWFNPEDAVGQPEDVLRRSVVSVQSWCDTHERRSAEYRMPVLRNAARLLCNNGGYIAKLRRLGIEGARLNWLGVDCDTFRIVPRLTPRHADDPSKPIIVGCCGRPTGVFKGDEARERIINRLGKDAAWVFMGTRWDVTETRLCDSLGVPWLYLRRDDGNRKAADLFEAYAGAPGKLDLTNLTDREFHAEYPTDYPLAYAMCDALLVTSRYEGGPSPPLEAWACGIPTVTTPVGRMPDLVIPAVNGTLVPFLPEGEREMDDEYACKAIRAWATRPADRQTIRSTVRHVTWKRWLDTCYEAYRAVGEERNRA